MNFSRVFVALFLLLFLAVGCTTTKSTQAKPLKTVYVANTNLSRYQVATIEPFEVTTSQAANDQVGMKMATDIANRLTYDFGPLFQMVRVGPRLGRSDELLVTGRITDYRPGSRAERLLGPGIGRAELKGDVLLNDGLTGQPLVIAPIDKLWAWGDIIGASKGINNMEEETAAAAANLIARTKGWQPPYPNAAMGGASAP